MKIWKLNFWKFFGKSIPITGCPHMRPSLYKYCIHSARKIKPAAFNVVVPKKFAVDIFGAGGPPQDDGAADDFGLPANADSAKLCIVLPIAPKISLGRKKILIKKIYYLIIFRFFCLNLNLSCYVRCNAESKKKMLNWLK